MGTIVVTTDLSDAAKRALPTAKQLADALDVPLVLLHVVHTPVLAPALAGSPDLDRSDAERELAELARELGADGSGEIRTRVAEAEEVVPGIVREAEAAGAEVLVVASHGRSGLERLRLGSVADQLLEASTVPVVCVPAHEVPAHGIGGGARIVVTSDLTETATHAFPFARRLATALSMPMSLLVIADSPSAVERAELDAQAAELGGGGAEVTTEVVAAPDAATGIVEQAQLEHAAFVCTASSPKSALRRWLLGSVSREVMRSGSFPVVIVPPSA